MAMISPAKATTKPAPAAQANLADLQLEALRRAQLLGIVGEGVLGLGDANGEVRLLVPFAQLGLDSRGEGDALGAVDAGGDQADLLLQGQSSG